MNYVGPFYALAALLALLSLYTGKVWGKVALVIAIFALPALLLFYYGFFRTSADFPLFYDLETNTAAALELYEGSGDVYGVEGSYSFPFPTYSIYWLASGFGAWGKAGVFVVFTLLASLAWLVSLWLLKPQWHETSWILILCVPAPQAIGQGQTATFVLLGITLFYLSLRREKFVFGGGIALALAGMIKPQLALIPIGLLIYAAVKPATRRTFAKAIAGMAAGMVIFVGLTLLLPHGVALNHYAEFFRDILPNLTPPTTELKVHSSPAFLVSVLTLRATANEALASFLATLTTLILIGAFAWKTRDWAKQNLPMAQVAVFWGFWAIFAPQQSWNFYAAWALPAVLLLLENTLAGENPRPRLALLAVTLAILNVQVAHTPLAVLGMSLLAYQVWTSYDSPHMLSRHHSFTN